MAITFRVNEKKLKTARGEQTFCFARAINNGETSIEQLQKLIAKISAISEGDVRSVLMTLTQLVALELGEERIVSLGDLGRLRVGLRSKASDSKEAFRSQDIKRIRVLFVPGGLIREALQTASLKRQDPKKFKSLKPSAGAGSASGGADSSSGSKPNGHTGL